MKEKTGEYYIRLALLSFEQAEEILKLQKTTMPDKKFGEIALDLGFITEEDLKKSSEVI